MTVNLFSFDQRFFKQIDWWLLAGLLALTAFGIVVIDGTTAGVESKSHYAQRQVMWWAISLVAFVCILFLDYNQLMKLAVPVYLVCLALLLGLLLHEGKTIRGTHSWYALGKLRFQPSEFTKIATVLVVSAYLARIKARVPGWGDLIVVAVLVLTPLVLVAHQPDLGTAVTFLPLIVVLHWAAGARRRIYVVVAGVVLLLVAGYGSVVVARGGEFPFLKPYQEERLRAFFGNVFSRASGDSSGEGLENSIRRRAGWAPLQARIALGSGRLWGKGWRMGTQTRLEFLPEAHTDYIFASCGEQFGFAGCAAVLALYAGLVFRSILIALRSKDWFGYLVVVGVLTIFITHVALNVGVAMDVLPVTGLPLPFLSCGGSFLLTTYVGFGLVMNVGMRRYMY